MHADFGICSSFDDGFGASGASPARVRRDGALRPKAHRQSRSPSLPYPLPDGAAHATIVGRFADSSNAARCRDGRALAKSTEGLGGAAAAKGRGSQRKR
jgi:hypothetical protein